jgi:fatty acid desaturase
MDFMGGSSLVWTHQHNVGNHISNRSLLIFSGHHPYSNREGGFQNEDYDPDAVSAYPILRTHPNQPRKWFHAYQHIYIWLIIGFSGLKWAYGDVKWMIRRRYNDIEFYKLNVWDYVLMAVMKTIFVIYTFVIPFSLHSFSHALLIVAIFVLTNGNIFILNFAVNHLLEENSFPDSSFEERDWAKLQVVLEINQELIAKRLWCLQIMQQILFFGLGFLLV